MKIKLFTAVAAAAALFAGAANAADYPSKTIEVVFANFVPKVHAIYTESIFRHFSHCSLLDHGG